MGKIKVIHPITRLILGGAQQNTIETCSTLNSSRYDAMIVSGLETGTEGELLSEVNKRGTPLTIIPELVRKVDITKDILALKRMVVLFKSARPHIVHTHSSKAGILGRWAAKIARIPIIIHTVHGWGHHNYQNPLTKSFFTMLERKTERITDKLIVVSYLNREKGLKDKIGNPDKYTTIHSSINLDEFSRDIACDVSGLKKELGIDSDCFVVGTVGRLSPQKNPSDFVQVAALVKKRIPNTKFLFIGDGPLRAETENLIQEMNLSGDILLPGLRRDIPELLRCMDVFILTSLWEGLPRVIPQAMTAGLPVVANAVDGVCEVLKEGVNGFLIPPKNISNMAEKIVRLFNDSSLREKMSRAGRKIAEEEFSLTEMVRRIEQLYEALLREKSNILEEYEGRRPPWLDQLGESAPGPAAVAKKAFSESISTPRPPMRVLHIFKEYYPDKLGGVQESIRQIARYTSDNGIINTVLTVSSTCDPPIFEFEEARVVREKTLLDLRSTPISLNFLNYFKKNVEGHDVLHFHFPWPFAELSYLMSNIHKPVLVTYHSDIVRQKFLKRFYWPFFKMFLNRVNIIVATSEEYLRSSTDLRPFRNKCKVVPLTIGCRRFPETDDSVVQRLREVYGEDFFLFVGVLRYYKGLDFLLEAMQGIDRRLVIVGKGPEEQHLKTKAADLGLTNVVFAGSVDDMLLPGFYKLCRAFVFPSCERSEAFGLSLLEASSFAKPMISTELGTGTSLVNQHQKTGLVVPPKNSAALHSALEQLSGDESLCRQYGQKAKQRSDEMFDHRVVGQQYLELYRELYGRKQ